MIWTKFKKQSPPEGARIKVKYSNGKMLTGTFKDGEVVYAKSCYISQLTLQSQLEEWRLVEERRGKSSKKRKARVIIKNPKLVHVKNRPSEEEMAKSPGNMERLVYESIDRIKAGMSFETCVLLICEQTNNRTKRPFAERFARDVVVAANRLIKEDYLIQKTEIISLHIQRYDKEIQSLLNYKAPHNETRPWMEEQQNIAARLQCLDILHQKESLLGIHRKEFKLVINNEDNLFVKEVKPILDLSKLSLEERIELNNLIEKTKRTEDEIKGVILRDVVKKEKEQIEENVVFEEIKNIERIDNREKAKEDLKSKQTSLSDIQEKIRLALRKRAKEEFERRGSKTVDDDDEYEVV